MVIPAMHDAQISTRSTRKTSKSASKSLKRQKQLMEEIKSLPTLIKINYKTWANGAKEFQLNAIKAQVLGQDVLIQAATGSGKTGIAAAPHLLASNRGKITLFISPLLALQEEQVSTFRSEFNLPAIATNGNHGGCDPKQLQKIVLGQYSIVIMSPEMLLSRRFIDMVLRRPKFGSRCLSVFIDEAHCISHWGSSFQKKYASIGIVRAFLPKSTPIVAATASLTKRVQTDLIDKLHFDKNYLFINIGNDRSNVSQIVRAMEHPMNSYHDLDFVIPQEIVLQSDIKKAFIYSADIKDGGRMIDYLNARVPEPLWSAGLVRPYNAAMSKKYRRNAMKLFKDGHIRILVCTDAAGMGCNIPDIDLVIQWKTPRNLSAWIQQAGRAARGLGRQGTAVMIVEKSAFEISTKNLQGKDQDSARQGSEYATTHGVKRGLSGSKDDGITYLAVSDLSNLDNAPKEGLYVYIQATCCRRIIVAKMFQNDIPATPSEYCCDICNPKLFENVRPSAPAYKRRNRVNKRYPTSTIVQDALYKWRTETKKRLYPRAMWTAQALLSDNICDLLSSIGPVTSKEQLTMHLQHSWARWETLGDNLFRTMVNINYPIENDSQHTNSKRPTPCTEPGSPSKRPRAHTSTTDMHATLAPPQFPPSRYDDFFATFQRPLQDVEGSTK